MMMRDFASRPAAVNCCSKMRRWESVSSVEPDLEETTMAVVAILSLTAARTWSGSVLSRTVSSTPAVAVMTSGASDEPPMPHSTMWLTPSLRSSSRRAVISSSRGADTSGASTQPRRMADSASASAPHKVASFAKMREATWSATSVMRWVAPASWAAPVAANASDVIGIYPSAPAASSASCTWFSSSCQLATNLSRPSVSSSSTTSL